MLLLNCRGKRYEGMFDGKITIFEPFEIKQIYDRVEGSHLLLKGTIYGIVDIPDPRLERETLFITKDGRQVVNEAFAKFFTIGLSNLRSTLDGVVGQFKGMNKDREASKMARDLPSPHVIACVKELMWIDEYLKKANADDYALVDTYMNNSPELEAEAAIKKADVEVIQEVSGSRMSGPSSYAKNGKQPVPTGKAGAHKKAA